MSPPHPLIVLPEALVGHVDLFRRKAALAAATNDHTDRLDHPEAKAYMTSRVENFLLIEASVGMD
jgi:hypothetical protein